MRIKKNVLFFSLLAMLFLFGCSGSDTTTYHDGQHPDSGPGSNGDIGVTKVKITISPNELNLKAGEVYKFIIEISGTNDDPIVTADCGTIINDGTFTAPSPSTATICNAIASVKNEKATAVITIAAEDTPPADTPLPDDTAPSADKPPTDTPPPSTVTVKVIPDTANVQIGASLQFTTEISGTTDTATWSIQETNCGSINTTGKYTAPNSATTCHVTATAKDKSATATVTIQAPVLQGIFVPIFDINQKRAGHTATLLSNGDVLIAGCYGCGNKTAEVYSNGQSVLVGEMLHTRSNHTATLLSNGTVLFVGGTEGGSTIKSEIYDPTIKIFQDAGSLISERGCHTATFLPENGSVIIIGGISSDGGLTSLIEKYDSATQKFTVIGNLITPRYGHTATLLDNGTIFISGGLGVNSSLLSSEIFDPKTNTSTTSIPLKKDRSYHTASLLPGNKILITGGASYKVGLVDTHDSGEIINLTVGASAYVPNKMSNGRSRHTATTLQNGTILIVGSGSSDQKTFSNTADLYDPTLNQFVKISSLMTDYRGNHTATLLQNGTVLIVGGRNKDNYVFGIASAEIYK